LLATEGVPYTGLRVFERTENLPQWYQLGSTVQAKYGLFLRGLGFEKSFMLYFLIYTRIHNIFYKKRHFELNLYGMIRYSTVLHGMKIAGFLFSLPLGCSI
jgi:hypothetical protein